MEPSLPLSNDSISLSAALANADDTLLELSYPEEEARFFDHLEQRQHDIENIVAWHLKLGRTEIPKITARHTWLRGNFNINIPVYIEKWSHQPHNRVLVRIPLPYKLGEAKCPNNVDEKMRCEVATFVWLLDKHPTVPVPILWGFGFPTGSCFSVVDSLSRKNSSNKDGSTHFAPYQPLLHHRHDHEYDLKTGYLIMEFIERTDGQLLSKYWSMDADKRDLRATFFADLSQMMLALSTVKFDRIGSLRFGDDGFLTLTNRPLHFRLQQLENKGVPCCIPRFKVYEETACYFLDLIACHEKRIRHQRNSIRDRSDAETQFAVQVAMRALLHRFSREDSSHGPFFFRLTDVHPNNVMVDETGHIKYFIDLEWAVVHPTEFIHPPVWLTYTKVDQLVGSSLEAYELLLHEFLDVFEKAECSFADPRIRGSFFTDALRWSWTSGAFFYFQALENPKTCCTLFLQHILPRLKSGASGEQGKDVLKAWAALWGFDGQDVIHDRLEDRAAYLNDLRKLFVQQE